ncbi:MAG: metallophosphoesterase [Tannerella sp.]|jgi:predicted phosphodiesterase|nr:metallophosphoesterase [Tannerella sp.]
MKAVKKAAFVLLGLLCWTGLYAQETFGIIYGPYLQQISENEATVMWITDRDAVSWVELAPDDNTHFYAQERPRYYQSIGGRRHIGAVHAVRLKGLQKGTTYRYRIYSTEVIRFEDFNVDYGKTVASEVYRREADVFTTFDNEKQSIRFTVVNDVHEKNDLLADMLGNVHERNPDFIIFNGDMCSNMQTREQVFEGFMKQSIARFASNIPFFYARGNHETRGRLAFDYLKYFPSPTGEPYYTFRCGPAFFVVLDGAEDKPDSDMEYYGLGNYDSYREEEARWLEKIVESEEFKQSPYRIVILHVPPSGDGWHGLMEVKRLFLPILNRANINLMLSGHLHRHIYYPAGQADCNFPLLINSNVHALDIDVDMQRIHLIIRDREQKIFKTLQFPRK